VAERGVRSTLSPWSSAEKDTFSIVTRSATAENDPSSYSGMVTELRAR